MSLVKNQEEIKKVSKACEVAAEILEELKKVVKAGATTAEINEYADGLFVKKKAIPAFKGYRGYRHSTCLSVNEEVVHGIPSGKVLKDGDIIGVDVGAIVDGYFGDNAETFPVGRISDKAKKLLAVTKNALYKSIAEAREGKFLGDVSNAIEEEAKNNDFSVVRDLYGHGVGSALHEDPLIPNYGEKGTGMKLLAGMTLAIEPMLNIGGPEIKTLDDGWTIVTADGSLSAHFEHTILVTKGSPVILTKR